MRRGESVGNYHSPFSLLGVTGQPFPPSAEQELSVYRFTQEALTNVRKRACAEQARAQSTLEPNVIRSFVTDLVSNGSLARR